MMNQRDLIPEQIKGKENNLLYGKTYGTRVEAINAFDRALEKMRDPLHWHEWSRIVVAQFLLPENPGLNITPLLSEGNFFRIEIPGPGPKTGDGYDWVKVDRVLEDSDPQGETAVFAMTFRACSNPEKTSTVSAHFFQSIATSTFILKRVYHTVSVSYHGRNEVPNMQTHSPFGNIRNAFVAMGAAAGLSETVWKIIIHGFLDE